MRYIIVAAVSFFLGFVIAALFAGRRTDNHKDDREDKYTGW